MNDPTRLDEGLVEEALRAILEPLDRQLARATMLIPLLLVTVVPAIFFVLWLYYDWYGRRALITACGACCAIAFCYMTWEILATRLARWRFDRRFPSGTPVRTLALRILSEMESPTRAEEKLRGALACSSGDRIIRRRTSLPADLFPAPLLPERPRPFPRRYTRRNRRPGDGDRPDQPRS